MTSSCTPRQRSASRATHGTPTTLTEHHPSKHLNPCLTSSPPHLQAHSISNELVQNPPNHDRFKKVICRSTPHAYSSNQTATRHRKGDQINQAKIQKLTSENNTNKGNTRVELGTITYLTREANLASGDRAATKSHI
jgi:hypothetical protein